MRIYHLTITRNSSNTNLRVVRSEDNLAYNGMPSGEDVTGVLVDGKTYLVRLPAGTALTSLYLEAEDAGATVQIKHNGQWVSNLALDDTGRPMGNTYATPDGEEIVVNRLLVYDVEVRVTAPNGNYTDYIVRLQNIPVGTGLELVELGRKCLLPAS